MRSTSATTGTTVIVGLDELPKSILYYRQQIQWFGGMGIIVLAVAILATLTPTRRALKVDPAAALRYE